MELAIFDQWLSPETNDFMKNIIVCVLLLLCYGAAAQEALTSVDKKAGKFRFKEDVHNYGEVPEGEDAVYDFVFKNTGKRPITIARVSTSCGCTVPTWSQQPVLPGRKGEIKVVYHTKGRPGRIRRSLYVYSDAQQQPYGLQVTGIVIPAAGSK